jgi:hypothetical protein
MSEGRVYSREMIIDESMEILDEYDGGITIRQLYYQLVTRGMVNDDKHYKKVVGAMTKARWNKWVPFGAFIDRERTVFGETDSEIRPVEEQVDAAKDAIDSWMNYYYLQRWSNQPNYVEVWIEKKALQGVFEEPCKEERVALVPCKGYPSLTFLNEACHRFDAARERGQKIVLLYYGDYDPSGSNIPISIAENFARMGYSDVNIVRCALNPDQIEEMGLPGVPPKSTDSRSRTWDGSSAVECDAIEPRTLAQMCTDDVKMYFDDDLYGELRDQEEKEKPIYKAALKAYVESL